MDDPVPTVLGCPFACLLNLLVAEDVALPVPEAWPSGSGHSSFPGLGDICGLDHSHFLEGARRMGGERVLLPSMGCLCVCVTFSSKHQLSS